MSEEDLTSLVEETEKAAAPSSTVATMSGENVSTSVADGSPLTHQRIDNVFVNTEFVSRAVPSESEALSQP